MTREDLEKLWPILEAYRQGKTIEVYDPSDDTWYELDDPGFDSDPDLYRVASEPKYRPFQNSEECLKEIVKHHPVGWIKSSRGIFNIFEIGEYLRGTKRNVYGYKWKVQKYKELGDGCLKRNVRNG